MNITEISDLVRSGNLPGGLRIDHRLIVERKAIADRLGNVKAHQLLQLATRLDLELLWYHMTGKEADKCASKQRIAKDLYLEAKSLKSEVA